MEDTVMIKLDVTIQGQIVELLYWTRSFSFSGPIDY